MVLTMSLFRENHENAQPCTVLIYLLGGGVNLCFGVAGAVEDLVRSAMRFPDFLVGAIDSGAAEESEGGVCCWIPAG